MVREAGHPRREPGDVSRVDGVGRGWRGEEGVVSLGERVDSEVIEIRHQVVVAAGRRYGTVPKYTLTGEDGQARRARPSRGERGKVRRIVEEGSHR